MVKAYGNLRWMFLAPLIGCNALFGIDEATEGTPDAEVPSEAGPDDAGISQVADAEVRDAGSDSACTANILEDNKNCGACGIVCSAACVKGRCKPYTITTGQQGVARIAMASGLPVLQIAGSTNALRVVGVENGKWVVRPLMLGSATKTLSGLKTLGTDAYFFVETTSGREIHRITTTSTAPTSVPLVRLSAAADRKNPQHFDVSPTKGLIWGTPSGEFICSLPDCSDSYDFTSAENKSAAFGLADDLFLAPFVDPPSADVRQASILHCPPSGAASPFTCSKTRLVPPLSIYFNGRIYPTKSHIFWSLGSSLESCDLPTCAGGRKTFAVSAGPGEGAGNRRLRGRREIHVYGRYFGWHHHTLRPRGL